MIAETTGYHTPRRAALSLLNHLREKGLKGDDLFLALAMAIRIQAERTFKEHEI